MAANFSPSLAKIMSDISRCNCSSSKPYSACCQPLHMQTRYAESAVELMRSRFCAFARQQYPYLLATTHKDFLGNLTLERLAQDPVEWLSLEIEQEEQQATRATVTFSAWYRSDGEIDAIHERSRFELVNQRWFYTDGDHLATRFPKRNDPCVCLSGKKSKQCCWR